jgi:hypothetical protein
MLFQQGIVEHETTFLELPVERFALRKQFPIDIGHRKRRFGALLRLNWRHERSRKERDDYGE